MNVKECKLRKAEKHNGEACQESKRLRELLEYMDIESENLKSDLERKCVRIHELMPEVNQLQDACNKAKLEAQQLQAQAHGGGMPGAFEDVHDMTE